MKAKILAFLALAAVVAVLIAAIVDSAKKPAPSASASATASVAVGQTGPVYLDHASVDKAQGGGLQLNAQWGPGTYNPHDTDKCLMASPALEDSVNGVVVGSRNGPPCSGRTTIKPSTKGSFTVVLGYGPNVAPFGKGSPTVVVVCPDKPGDCHPQ